jgi:hypothetical protein
MGWFWPIKIPIPCLPEAGILVKDQTNATIQPTTANNSVRPTNQTAKLPVVSARVRKAALSEDVKAANWKFEIARTSVQNEIGDCMMMLIGFNYQLNSERRAKASKELQDQRELQLLREKKRPE